MTISLEKYLCIISKYECGDTYLMISDTNSTEITSRNHLMQHRNTADKEFFYNRK